MLLNAEMTGQLCKEAHELKEMSSSRRRGCCPTSENLALCMCFHVWICCCAKNTASPVRSMCYGATIQRYHDGEHKIPAVPHVRQLVLQNIEAN
ncbi:hypothetical protein M011DRAFT_148494 [Sporormia fimetaria CBS 119925]|uniref:Uncharacterized protein n=1 Tax=Sporormia fimetaria CBS 119925 TaxID=1340428 RepID=A0A6A6V3D4_9PLEO|nr:hypothetical protein M011DRAFT_148494 [Sporormia fimetaria CBS 119925]